MGKFKRVIRKLIHPGAIWAMLLPIMGVGLLVAVFFVGMESTRIGIAVYPLTLYSLVVLAVGLPDIVGFFKALISKNKFGHQYLNDQKFQMKIVLYRGLFVNFCYVLFYLITGLVYWSAWFIAVGVYYVVLSLMRFLLLRKNKAISQIESKKQRDIKALHTYRLSGYLMLALNVAMAGMVIQMIWKNKGYQHSRFVIYLSASYAFYCFITAIINMVKYHRMEKPLLSAVKMIGFASALMSLLALQTAMIQQFGGSDSFRRLMNTATGGSVCLIVFAIAIFMIIRASIELKKHEPCTNQSNTR